MAITKVSRGLLSTGVSDSSDATAITIDSSENSTFSGSILSNIAGNNSTGGNIRIGLVSDDAAKYNAITSTQYDSGTETEGFTLISAHSTDASTNNINIGGSFSEQNSATSIRLYTAANATTRTGSERMRIDSSGNVGIGLTNQANKLQVDGDICIGKATTGADLKSTLKMRGSNGSSQLQVFDLVNDGENGRVDFQYNRAGSSAQTIMTFGATVGTVGVGTVSPGCVTGGIHAVHDATEGTPTFTGGEVAIFQRNFNSSQGAEIALISGSASGGNINFGDKDDADAGRIQYDHNNNALRFFTNGANERMRIDSSGNLLVGKTTNAPSSQTGSVNYGDGFFALTLTNSRADTLDVYNTSVSAYRFYVTNAGQIHATSTSITAISDERLKENITDLETGLSEVMALKPRRFDWKNGDGENVAGFVAQEVETVLPDLIGDFKHDDLDDAKSVKMGDMIPTLVKAIQELSAEVEELKTKLESK